MDSAHASIPHLSSSLSIVGSSIIVFMILRRRKVRLALMHNRLIFVMSIIDILNSLSNAVGPAAAPKESSSVIYGAKGTHATCTAQVSRVSNPQCFYFSVSAINMH